MSSPQPAGSAPAPVSEGSQAAQAALAMLAAEAVMKLWPSFDPHDRTQVPAFKAAVAQEVIAHAQASATLAIHQYETQRQAAGVTLRFRPVAADPPSLADISAAVDEALSKSGVLDLAPDHPDAGTAVADAKARVAGAAGDAVFDAGVRTILDNAGHDRAARGYARIPEPGACAFCLMLATRGAVYKADRKGRVANGRGDELTARGIKKGQRHGAGDSFAASDAKFTDHPDAEMPSSIKVHDNCRCHPEPVWGVYEAPARVRAADDLWKAAAKGGRGKATKRFRQAVEGRLPPDDAAFTDEQRAHIAHLLQQLK